MKILLFNTVLFLMITFIVTDNCSQMDTEFTNCSEEYERKFTQFWTSNLISYLRAAIEYKAELEAGDDGRPAWHARKSCNYITSAVEVRDS